MGIQGRGRQEWPLHRQNLELKEIHAVRKFLGFWGQWDFFSPCCKSEDLPHFQALSHPSSGTGNGLAPAGSTAKPF